MKTMITNHNDGPKKVDILCVDSKPVDLTAVNLQEESTSQS